MTLAPRRSPLPFTGLEDIAAALRERGSRLSAARRLVLESLFAADGPVSAEWIADGLGGQRTRLDVTSVYRGLERLELLGVVRHVHLGHGPGLYTLEGDGQREYLVCERCDRVDTVDTARLDEVRAEIRRAFGYEARFSHFPIVGLCERCGAAARKDGPPASKRSTRGVPMSAEEHRHDAPHGHGELTHSHPHKSPEHDHAEHDHEHSHGDHVHSHPHVHEKGLEEEHQHAH